MRAWCLLALLLVGCGKSDGGVDGSECDESPIVLDDGTMIMYGCAFYHQVYKINLNGEPVTGDVELCGADGFCLYRLTHTCAHWRLIDNGTISIIVDADTGEIDTHARFHGYGTDDLPDFMMLPLEQRER
jgi:hypothetical protein